VTEEADNGRALSHSAYFVSWSLLSFQEYTPGYYLQDEIYKWHVNHHESATAMLLHVFVLIRFLGSNVWTKAIRSVEKRFGLNPSNSLVEWSNITQKKIKFEGFCQVSGWQFRIEKSLSDLLLAFILCLQSVD